MAKKGFLPAASLETAVNNVSKAGKKKEDSNTTTPNLQTENKEIEVVETKTKIERYKERPKLTNIHIDYDTDDKLAEIKKMRNRGKKGSDKITIDDLIYDAIIEWLERHYNK